MKKANENNVRTMTEEAIAEMTKLKLDGVRLGDFSKTALSLVRNVKKIEGNVLITKCLDNPGSANIHIPTLLKCMYSRGVMSDDDRAEIEGIIRQLNVARYGNRRHRVISVLIGVVHKAKHTADKLKAAKMLLDHGMLHETHIVMVFNELEKIMIHSKRTDDRVEAASILIQNKAI